MEIHIPYDAEEHRVRSRISAPETDIRDVIPGHLVYRIDGRGFDIDLVVSYAVQPGKDGRLRPVGWQGNSRSDPAGTFEGFLQQHKVSGDHTP